MKLKQKYEGLFKDSNHGNTIGNESEDKDISSDEDVDAYNAYDEDDYDEVYDAYAEATLSAYAADEWNGSYAMKKWTVDDPIEAAELDGVAYVAQQSCYLGAPSHDFMDDPESCADIIQECTAFFAKGKGKGKGKGSYPVRPSNLSIEDRRKMLARLKAKTP